MEILLPVVREAVKNSGLARTDIEFTCSGSSDFLQGQPFAFVMALDAVGAWPPIKESHVEMDGAWALYEAWVKIQTGEVESALVYSFGKCSSGDLAEVQALQLDPYCVTQLWPDADSIAAMQARLYMERAGKTERDLAEVAVRSRGAANANPHAVAKGSFDAEKLLSEPYRCSPLRDHDCPQVSDGATAMVLVAGDKAKQLCDRPVWIRGIDHRIDPPALGTRDLTRSESGTDRRGEGGRRQRHRRLRRARRALHAPGADPARVAGARRRRPDQPVGRHALRAHHDVVRTQPNRRSRAAYRERRGQPRRRPRHPGPLPAAEPGVRAGG